MVEVGENVVCDDGQENDSEEQEKDADETKMILLMFCSLLTHF